MKLTRRFFVLIFCMVVAFSPSYAQLTKEGWYKRPPNLLHGNVLGEASLISLNYERSFFNTEYFFLSVSAGIGYQTKDNFLVPPDEAIHKSYLTIPFHLSMNCGKGLHYIEIGYGRTYVFYAGKYHFVKYPILGYRSYPSKSHKMYARVYTHLYIPDEEYIDYIFSPFGLSIGFAL